MEQQTISSDLIRGHIDTIILYTLLDSDKFAEQISDTIEKKSGYAYKINQATLYSALKRLQNSKFLDSYQKDIDNGIGRRKFFTLTENGKQVVEQNLSSWSYSRSIIDKLIDCEPQPVYKTEYVEKIVQVPVEKVVYKDVYVEDKKENVSPIAPPSNMIENMKDNDEQIKTVESQTVKQQESVQEINFRNIINGLIESCNVKNEKNNEKIVEEPIAIGAMSREDVVEIEDVQKFNDTISTERKTPTKRCELNTIDFSDLMEKAADEGYKLRVSNKNSYIVNGNLLLNKLNLLTSIAMFILFFIEFTLISLIYGKLLNISFVLSLGIIAVAAIYPLVCVIKYAKNHFYIVSKTISKDIILTSAIIVFNLLLINFASLLLFGVDFSVKKDVVLYLIIPIILYADILVYSIVRYCFAHHKSCKISNK